MKKIIFITTALLMMLSVSVCAMNSAEFDKGMKKGIDFYESGAYYEALDAFESFANINYGAFNNGQKTYFDGWLDGAKKEVERLEFDKGMKKGIEYFNKGMYYEAIDEFGWFYGDNFKRFNDGQSEYFFGYYNSAKNKVSAWEECVIAENMIKNGKGFASAVDYLLSKHKETDREYSEIIEAKIEDICYRWKSQTGSNLIVEKKSVKKNKNGVPEATFVIRNISGKKVTSFVFDFWCYNQSGVATSDSSVYTGGVTGYGDNANLENGQARAYTIVLNNHKNTVDVKNIKFTKISY